MNVNDITIHFKDSKIEYKDVYATLTEGWIFIERRDIGEEEKEGNEVIVYPVKDILKVTYHRGW